MLLKFTFVLLEPDALGMLCVSQDQTVSMGRNRSMHFAQLVPHQRARPETVQTPQHYGSAIAYSRMQWLVQSEV